LTPQAQFSNNTPGTLFVHIQCGVYPGLLVIACEYQSLAYMATPITTFWGQALYYVKTYPVPIVVSLILLNLLWNKFQPGLIHIPGPTIAAYTKWWRVYDVSKGKAHLTSINLHKKYGQLVRVGPNHISVSDPKAISLIYSTKEDFTKV